MTSEPASAPENLPFTLQNGEEVFLVARRHRVYLALNLGRDIFLGLVPVIVLALIIRATAGFDGTLGGLLLAAMALWLVFWAIKAYFTWYKYQNDIWVVTNQRIVDSLKRNWFHHRMSSADLVNVEDMSVDRGGVFATMFNFGNLICQTAGSRSNFVLSGIPEPTEVLALVDRSRDAARRDLVRGNIV